MIMNGLEIFRFHRVHAYPIIRVHAGGDVAYQVLDEFRVVIGTFSDEFFVRSLDQSVDLAGRLTFHNIYKLFYPQIAFDLGGQGNVGALVMGAIIRYLFGAGAQAGDGDLDFDDHIHGVTVLFSHQGNIIIQ